MRICLVASPLHPVPPPVHGALEQQVAEHARGLAALGHEVHVATVEGASPSAADARVVLHRLGQAFERDPRRGNVGLLASQLGFARRARRLLHELAPDVVHWHARYPCLAALDGAGRAGGARRAPWRTVYHAHNWKRAEGMRHPVWSVRSAAAAVGAMADERIARGVDHVIAVSEFVRKSVLATARLPDERASVVTNVVDSARFHPGPLRAPGAPEILFVGRIAAEKGVEVLVDALPAVARAHPDVTLTIVGPASGGTERGAYLRRCERRIAALGLTQRVRFAGAVPNSELPHLLQRCRLLAVPSLWGEPCGVVVLEALACGVPLVASRVGGIPELIEEERTGRLCAPGDAEAWGRSLSGALDDEALRRAAAEHGPRRIAERHVWSAVAPRLCAVYEALLDGARRP